MWITCSTMSSRRDSSAIPMTAWYARFCRDEATSRSTSSISRGSMVTSVASDEEPRSAASACSERLTYRLQYSSIPLESSVSTKSEPSSTLKSGPAPSAYSKASLSSPR